MGMYPINRQQNDIQAVKKTLSLLKNDKAICIFPEGTRIPDTEMNEAKNGVALFEGALLVFEALDPNIERHLKVATALQKAIRSYHVIYDEKKRSYYPDITVSFFQEGR